MAIRVFLPAAWLAGALLLGSAPARAGDLDGVPMDLGSLAGMNEAPSTNGLNLRDFANFWRSWQLITVRYRADIEQQRFVYANDVAAKALKDGAKTYPDGARFAKIVFMTAKDEAFPSSVEIRAPLRVQLMEKNQARFPESDGWGYAIFNGRAPMSPEKSQEDAKACHACHKIVAARDHVFVRPFFLGLSADIPLSPALASGFTPRQREQISPFEQRIVKFAALPDAPATVRTKVMTLFVGSINETLPALVATAAKTPGAYLLSDEDSGLFLFVWSDAGTKGCSSKQHVLTADHRPSPGEGEGQPGRQQVRSAVVCDGTFKWGKPREMRLDAKL